AGGSGLTSGALDPSFGEAPDRIALFAGGISGGAPPRLWIDAIAHVDMGRDKRTYRFVQDSRFGRTVLAESADTAEMIEAVTRYVARRIIEREHALAADQQAQLLDPVREAQYRRRGRWRSFRAFIYGLVLGGAAIIGALFFLARHMHSTP